MHRCFGRNVAMFQAAGWQAGRLDIPPRKNSWFSNPRGQVVEAAGKHPDSSPSQPRKSTPSSSSRVLQAGGCTWAERVFWVPRSRAPGHPPGRCRRVPCGRKGRWKKQWKDRVVELQI